MLKALKENINNMKPQIDDQGRNRHCMKESNGNARNANIVNRNEE